MTHRPPPPLRSYPPAPARPSGARAASFVFGVLGAMLVGVIAMLRTGSTGVGIGAALVTLGIGLVGAFGRNPVAIRTIATVLFLLVVAGGWWLVSTALDIHRALTFTAGSAAPADPAALAAAEDKITSVEAQGAFRLELTEKEIEAVIQNGLTSTESPLARVEVDIVDGDPQGTLEFTGEFKNGELTVAGTLSTRLDAGAVVIDVVRLDLGSLTLPGLAQGAIEDLLASVADLNSALEVSRADVQAIAVGDDRIVIVGTQAGGSLLTSTSLLADLQAQAAVAGGGGAPPPERLGPGVVDGISAPGSVFYVALGDSLAANVGVARPRDGYVSRVHNQLQIRDGREYGLRNFGVSGETSGTLLRSGQLDAAIAFITANPVAYITIDIGANDLLGHLGSADCADDIAAPACAARLTDSFTAYRQNLPVILGRLREAAPQATIVFMTAYNPFSFGFAGVAFERDSTAILDDFNDAAVRIAADHGILVADAFTPMLGTAGVTTHMFDNPPDIHPIAIGYDILGAAIVDALP